MGIRDRSESRRGTVVRVLAVHTSEGNDKPDIDDAAALRDAAWWTGSSHAIADGHPGSLLTPAEGCVPYERAAWTLRSGNLWSENIELIGWAGWTRAEWLADPTLLGNCARWLADRSKVDRGDGRRIPLVKLTPAQYRAGQWGVIGHNDHTVGYSDGTHWDPGPNFPWDIVLPRARQIAQGEDDMPLNADDLAAIRKAVLDIDLGGGVSLSSFVRINSQARDAKGKVAPIPNAVLDIDLGGGVTLAKFASGTAGRSVDTGAVDPTVLAAALKDALGDQLAADVAARLTVSAKPA